MVRRRSTVRFRNRAPAKRGLRAWFYDSVTTARRSCPAKFLSMRWNLCIRRTSGSLAPPARRCPGVGGQRAAEISQAALELFGEVGADGWLSLGVAAGWLGPRVLGLADTECCVQQAVRIGRAGVLGDEQQHTPVRCLEYGQQAPCAVQVKPTDPREGGFARQPHTCGCASGAVETASVAPLRPDRRARGAPIPDPHPKARSRRRVPPRAARVAPRRAGHLPSRRAARVAIASCSCNASLNLSPFNSRSSTSGGHNRSTAPAAPAFHTSSVKSPRSRTLASSDRCTLSVR
jgi:hypothetical protein